MARSETAANLALTVMSILVTIVLLERFVVQRLSSAPQAVESQVYRVGDELTGGLRDLIEPSGTAVAIMVVSQNCRFCTDSVGFYRQLTSIESTGPQNSFRTVFVGLLGNDDGRNFVARNNLPAAAVKPTPPDLRERVRGTPTLILVDGAGRIHGSWLGRLSADQERLVVSRIHGILENTDSMAGQLR
jgi:hypothetical protein